MTRYEITVEFWRNTDCDTIEEALKIAENAAEKVAEHYGAFGKWDYDFTAKAVD